MKVKIKKDIPECKIKAGEVMEAERQTFYGVDSYRVTTPSGDVCHITREAAFVLVEDQQSDPSDERIKEAVSAAVDAMTKPSNPKDVIGSTKPPLHHIPCGPLFQIGGALLSGACKYGAHNWRVVGVRSDVYYDAMLRHVMQWWEGEELDPESGMSHLAHAAACCIILLDAAAQHKLTDNRPPKGNNPSLAVADQVKAILANYPNPVEPFTELGAK